MRTNSVSCIVVSAFAIGVVFACGSSPKPDANPPPMPSATAMPSAMPSTDDAGSSGSASTNAGGDAGGATATADAGTSKDQQCDQLRNDAQAEMDAERIKVDKQCKKDADCVAIKGRACEFTCTNASIPKAEQKDWDKEMASVKDGLCKKWADLGCKKPDAKPPTCADDAKKPACDKGRCILK